MAYRVESVQDADLEYIVRHTFGTFGTSYEFLNIMYAGHQTETGQISIASRFSTIKNGSSNTKWIKAVAEGSHDIAGFSMWTIIDQEKPPEADLKGGSWSNKEEEEYARALHKALLTDRRKTIRENELPIMSKCSAKPLSMVHMLKDIALNMMVVFTPHQRKGAGKQLLAWGLQLVDQLQALVRTTSKRRFQVC
jgi:hypothetical protein